MNPWFHLSGIQLFVSLMGFRREEIVVEIRVVQLFLKDEQL